MCTTPLREYVAVLSQVAEQYPDAELVRNEVGCLVVVVEGRYVGWIEFVSPEFCLFEE